MVGDISHQLRTVIFRDMLEICQLRGRDSTGAIHVGKDLEYDFVKRVGPPMFLLDSREYEAKVERKEAIALIGHCRSKTVGEVNIKNAHPFDFAERQLCGVHNGTLRAYHQLDTHEYGKVDSEVMYGHMAIHGAKDTFETVEGAFACVWWDGQEKTINFARNAERPLWFTWSEDLKTMFWASEPWWFGAVERKIKLWDGGEQKAKYIELPVHQIWSFRLNPKPTGEQKLLIQQPVQIIVPKPRPSVVHTYNWNRGNSHEDGRWERVGPGSYRRDRGGEVSNPFLDRQKIQEQMDEMWAGFDDDLPFELSPDKEGQTPTDSENSQLSNVEFLRHSLTPSDTELPKRPSRSSRKPILSLPGSSSSALALSSSDVHCADIGKSTKTSRPQMSRGVSLRVLAGVTYITQNVTGREWDWPQFQDKTGSRCCFCKTEVIHPHEVGEIISEDKFICKPCLVEPKGELVLPKTLKSSVG